MSSMILASVLSVLGTTPAAVAAGVGGIFTGVGFVLGGVLTALSI